MYAAASVRQWLPDEGIAHRRYNLQNFDCSLCIRDANKKDYILYVYL